MIIVLDGRPHPATIEYGGLRLQLFAEAEIRTGRRQRDAALGVISCLEDALQHNFCILAADMCELVRSDVTQLQTAQQFREYVARWAQIFSPGARLSREAELGLWGELEVLSSLPDPELAVAAWHGPEAATFDFGGNKTYIEVKTSTAGHRHHFALEQVSAPTGSSDLFIASVFVVDDPASGKSLDDQVTRLRSRLSATLAFDQKLANLSYRPGVYTKRYSLREIRYIAGDVVPRPRQIDGGVSEVRFVAELGAQKPAPAKALAAALKRLSG